MDTLNFTAGNVFEDRDKRCNGRLVRIVRTEGEGDAGFAFCERVHRTVTGFSASGVQQTRIRLSNLEKRFKWVAHWPAPSAGEAAR